MWRVLKMGAIGEMLFMQLNRPAEVHKIFHQMGGPAKWFGAQPEFDVVKQGSCTELVVCLAVKGAVKEVPEEPPPAVPAVDESTPTVDEADLTKLDEFPSLPSSSTAADSSLQRPIPAPVPSPSSRNPGPSSSSRPPVDPRSAAGVDESIAAAAMRQVEASGGCRNLGKVCVALRDEFGQEVFDAATAMHPKLWFVSRPEFALWKEGAQLILGLATTPRAVTPSGPGAGPRGVPQATAPYANKDQATPTDPYARSTSDWKCAKCHTLVRGRWKSLAVTHCHKCRAARPDVTSPVQCGGRPTAAALAAAAAATAARLTSPPTAAAAPTRPTDRESPATREQSESKESWAEKEAIRREQEREQVTPRLLAWHTLATWSSRFTLFVMCCYVLQREQVTQTASAFWEVLAVDDALRERCVDRQVCALWTRDPATST